MSGLLNEKNYAKGFLIAEHFMAGIAESEAISGGFDVFVVDTDSLESVYFQSFNSLHQAIEHLHTKRKDWKFEPTSGCSSGECADGGCKGGDCSLNAKQPAPSIQTAIQKQTKNQ